MIETIESRMQEFVNGWDDAAHWSTSNSEHYENLEAPETLDEAESTEPESEQRLREAAREFFRANRADLEEASEYRDWDYLGHDAWMTCAGHGTGFWDREEIPERLRDRLTEACEGHHAEHACGWIDCNGVAHWEGI